MDDHTQKIPDNAKDKDSPEKNNSSNPVTIHESNDKDNSKLLSASTNTEPAPGVKKDSDQAGGTTDNKTSEQEKKELLRAAFIFLAIVLVIILIIVTLGYFFKKYNKTQYEEAKPRDADDDLTTKKKILATIEPLIAELEQKKVQIQKKEKRYLITARLGIGLMMLSANYWFYERYILWNNTFELNKLVTFNSSVLLVYSFAAFLLYGTPANLVSNLKNIITNFLKRRNIDTLTELEELMSLRDTLKKEIEILEAEQAKSGATASANTNKHWQ